MRTLRAIPAALLKGFSEWQTLLVLLCLSLVCAGIAVTPDLVNLFKFYGHAPLAEGKPLLSWELLLGIGHAFPGGSTPLRALGPALLVALPLTLFLSGGVVWRAWTVDGFRLVDFIAESARMFGRVVRTLLWSLLLLLAGAVLLAGVSALLHAAHRDSLFTAPGLSLLLELPFTGWAVAHLLLLGVLWALWRLTLDTARVLALVEEVRKTRKAVWRAFLLVVRAPGAWAAYTVLGAAELCAVLLMMRIHAALPEGNTALAVLALLWAQLVVLVRAGFQVSTTAFAADLVRHTRAATAPAVVATAAEPVAPPPGAPAPSEASMAEGEPFELLTAKEPPRTGSTSEMPLVDADLLEDEPGGGSSKQS
ncbi:MAG: hypothetical protein ACLPJH_14045 [Myxococcaceae bacterium]